MSFSFASHEGTLPACSAFGMIFRKARIAKSLKVVRRNSNRDRTNETSETP